MISFQFHLMLDRVMIESEQLVSYEKIVSMQSDSILFGFFQQMN